MKVNCYRAIIYVLLIVCYFSIGCDDMQMLDTMGGGTVDLPEKHLALFSESEEALTPINDMTQWSRNNAVWEKIKGEEAPPKPDFAADWDVDLFEHWFYLYTGFGDGSHLVYDFGDNNFSRFECSVLLPYFCEGLASIEMKWFANNVEVYNSGVINTDVALEVAFDLPPRTRYLKLQVTNAGEDDSCNYFVIGNPRLIPVDPALLMPEPVMQLSEGYLSLTSRSADAITAINDTAEWHGWGSGIWEQTKEQEVPLKPTEFTDWDTDRFEHWFYSFAASRIVFDLKDQNFVYFQCASILPNTCGGSASVEFIWFADDVEVYNSGVIRSASGIRMAFDIPAGTKTLTLQVTDGGDTISCDHYIIGNARLFAKKPEPTLVDMYQTLPEILSSPELEPGKYRIIPTSVGRSDSKITTFYKTIGDTTTDSTEVLIVLNRQPWNETSEGKQVIERDDEIVVEIVRKIRVNDEPRGRFTHTYHEYEGIALLNLTRPERLFEYETVESPPHLAIFTETGEAIHPINSEHEWSGWNDFIWGKTKDSIAAPIPGGFYPPFNVETYDHWFYSHAPCRFIFDLGTHNYTYFDATVQEPNLGCNRAASIEVIWFADGVEVYNSELLSAGDIMEVGFDIPAGTKTLTLQVTDGGNGNSCDGFFIGNPTLRLEKPKVIPHVFIDPAEIRSPAVGQQFTVPIKIANGESVKNYTINVAFDSTALEYISIANADYLSGAIVIPPVVSDGSIQLTVALLNGESDGDGTLATITFEVVAVKSSDIQLSEVIIANSAGERLEATTADAKVVVP